MKLSERPSLPISLAIIGVALFLGGLRPFVGSDYWFHLTVGREVLANWTVPSSEFYLFVFGSPTPHFFEWGFGVVLYLVHQLAGFEGISVLVAALVVATFFLMFAARGGGAADAGSAFQPPVVALLCMAIFLYGVGDRISPRPEIFVYFFLAATAVVAKQALEADGKRFLGWGAAFSALCLFWGQIHPSLAFAFPMLAIVAYDRVLQAGRSEFRPAFKRTFVLSIFSMSFLLNPYGIDQLLVPFKMGMESSMLSAVIEEFQPASGTKVLSICSITILAIAAAMNRPLKSVNWVDVAVLLVLALLALKHVRGEGLVALFATRSLLMSLGRGTETGARAPVDSTGQAFSAGKRRVSAALVLSAILLLFMFFHAEKWNVALGLDNPAKARVDALEKVLGILPDGLNIGTTYENGSMIAFLLKGRGRIFIDSRASTREHIDLYKEIFFMKAGDSYRRFWDRFGVDVVIGSVMHTDDTALAGGFANLVADPEWVPLPLAPDGLTVMVVRKSFAMTHLPMEEETAGINRSRILEAAREYLSGTLMMSDLIFLGDPLKPEKVELISSGIEHLSHLLGPTAVKH